MQCYFQFHFSVPFKYEALMQDYLNLGNARDDKNNQYAPVYPMFRARLSKRRQNSNQSLESAGEQSSSEQSSGEQSSNEQSSNELSSGELYMSDYAD